MTVRLAVKVVPGASQSRIAGWLGKELKIRVSAPPEKGKANKQVKVLLANATGLTGKQVRIIAGHTSTHKLVEPAGINSACIGRLSGTRKTPEQGPG